MAQRRATGKPSPKLTHIIDRLFDEASPTVVGFISKLSRRPKGSPPLFPEIFGTGFFVGAEGVAVTNRHVVEVFERVPKHPETGEPGLAAILFLPGDDGLSWQMLVVDVRDWCVLGEFTSNDRWYGQTVPDIGFVQLGVRDVSPLRLADEDFYLRIGMEIASIGYPMGTLPLTALGKLSQMLSFGVV